MAPEQVFKKNENNASKWDTIEHDPVFTHVAQYFLLRGMSLKDTHEALTELVPGFTADYDSFRGRAGHEYKRRHDIHPDISAIGQGYVYGLYLLNTYGYSSDETLEAAAKKYLLDHIALPKGYAEMLTNSWVAANMREILIQAKSFSKRDVGILLDIVLQSAKSPTSPAQTTSENFDAVNQIAQNRHINRWVRILTFVAGPRTDTSMSTTQIEMFLLELRRRKEKTKQERRIKYAETIAKRREKNESTK